MMASPAPAKSQQKPLHNFPLPSLWSKSHHRGRRHHAAASPPPERRRISDPTVKKTPQWESRRISVSIPRPSHPTAHNKPPLPTPPPPSDRKKISIKIRGTHLPKRETEAKEERERVREAEAEEREREREAKEERERVRKREREAKEERERVRKREREAKAEADDELAMTWNLRPRKQHKTKRNNANLPENNKTICAASEAAADGGDKPKFSLSLSKTEIEEDLFAMTGSRPTRRPKKRPRTLQKQLDDIFPGMWLHSITPESYKVNEASEKP